LSKVIAVENRNHFLDLNHDKDRQQNLINSSLSQASAVEKMSPKYVPDFGSILAVKQTDEQIYVETCVKDQVLIKLKHMCLSAVKH